MPRKKKHGGKRDGAGRHLAHPEGPAVVVNASVPGGLVERLNEIAERNNWNRSQAVTEAIRGFVGTSGKQRNRTQSA